MERTQDSLHYVSVAAWGVLHWYVVRPDTIGHLKGIAGGWGVGNTRGDIMKYVVVTEQEEVKIVTINRQETLNALNLQVLQELEQTFEEIDTDRTRCVILTGAGYRAFAAGADISMMQHFTKEEGKRFSEYGTAVMRKIETCPVPVIAAINGYALGGGCELTLACDIRLASENAILGLPEVGIGVLPGFGGSQRLSRLIPVGKAKELLYTAGRMKAEEAKEIGLVNEVYPQQELMEQALKMAHKIGRNAPIGVRSVKKAVNDGLDQKLLSALSMESQYFGACFETEDQIIGMTAFLNKKPVECFLNR